MPCELEQALERAELELAYERSRRILENKAIIERVNAIEEIIIAHQGWTVLQKGERQCHMNVRHLIVAIKNIIGRLES